VSRPHLLLLLALSAIWGASFMFIKVAVRELDPATLIAGRIGLAALVLAAVVPPVVGGRRTLDELRRRWRPLVLVGLLNTAAPFWLLSWGETRIESGLAACIQAAVPIFMALIALGFFPAERVNGMRLVGLLLGFGGVALLVGIQPRGEAVGALAVVGMALFYAIGGLLAARFLHEVPPLVVALGTTVAAAAMVVGPGIARAPAHVPGWKAIASVVVLAVVGTALAYLLFFQLIAGAGAGRAALVTYLVPPFALAYGAGFLGERVGAAAVAGLALTLAGVALATGRVRLRRRWMSPPSSESFGRRMTAGAAGSETRSVSGVPTTMADTARPPAGERAVER
jgi:drug/metabolite transporter (DMT)-like permease